MKRFLCVLTAVLLSAVMFFSCGKTVEAKWQEQLDLGMRYLEELDYDNAILAFTKAIEVDPNRSEAYVERAKLYVQRNAEGDLALAAADYEKAIELGEETVNIFLALAFIYEEQGDLEKALAIIQQCYDLTGAPELYQKLQELEARPRPQEGFPKTERYDYDDGAYWIYEYDEFGQIIKKTRYLADDTLDETYQYTYDEFGQIIKTTHYLADDTLDYTYEYTYNEAGYLTQEVYTNENPEDDDDVLVYFSVANYSGDALGRELDETIYWVGGIIDHFEYDYQGLQVFISVRIEEADGTVVEAVVPYTMEAEENRVSWGGSGWSSDGLRWLVVREYDSEGFRIKEVTLNPDGSIYEE